MKERRPSCKNGGGQVLEEEERNRNRNRNREGEREREKRI